MGTRPLILSAELVEVSKDCVSPSKGADVELGRRVRQRSLGVVAPVTVIPPVTVIQKAVWARGLFVSYLGFTAEGLQAFGRAKRTVGMCGQDFDQAFERQIPLDEVIRLKARRAAETGEIFTPVRELFP